MERPLLLLSSVLVLLLAVSCCSGKTFTCTGSDRPTCDALIDYHSPNATTISALQTLFNLRNLRTILGANNLPLSTLRNFSVPANSTFKIPFPCLCRNGTGVSNRRPLYTVVPGDGLFHIATDVFSGLVTFPEIQAVNNISDANLIEVGQRLWIPLPCSCDSVEGQAVVHYGHRVADGSSAEGIAAQYDVSLNTLSKLNNLPNPPALMAGDVLDVPLRACSSSVNSTSLDSPLLVANGTYVFTANSCVRCKCDATLNWMLQCEPSGLNSSCTPIHCEGSGNLYLGNTTASGCNSTTCAYAGYTRAGSVLTTLVNDSTTCPAPRSSATRLQGWKWNGVVIFVHIMVLCISFHKA